MAKLSSCPKSSWLSVVKKYFLANQKINLENCTWLWKTEENFQMECLCFLERFGVARTPSHFLYLKVMYRKTWIWTPKRAKEMMVCSTPLFRFFFLITFYWHKILLAYCDWYIIKVLLIMCLYEWLFSSPGLHINV